MSPISRDASCAISPSAHLLTRIIRALPQLSSRRGAFVDSSRHERVWTWLCGRILPDADEARQWLDKSKADGSFSSDMRLLVTLSLSADEDPRVRSLADRLLGKLFVLGGADIVAQCLPDGETLDAVAHWTENICFDSESLQDETRLSDIVRCSRLQALTGCLGNNAIAGMLGMNNVIALCARRVFDACAQVRREVANVLVEVSGFEFDSQLCHGVCEELIFAATAAFEDATTSAVDNFARERVCVLDLAWHVIGVKEFLPLHALLLSQARVLLSIVDSLPSDLRASLIDWILKFVSTSEIQENSAMEFIDTLITHGSHRALIDGLRIALVMKTSVVGKPKTELAALCVRIIAQMYNNDCGSTAAKASVAQRRQLLRLAVDGQTLWSTNQCQAQQHLCAALKSHHILSDTVQLRTVLGALDGKLLDAQMQSLIIKIAHETTDTRALCHIIAFILPWFQQWSSTANDLLLRKIHASDWEVRASVLQCAVARIREMGYCVMTHEVIEELLERGLVDEESYVCRDALNLLSVAVLMGDGTINISNFRKSIGTLVSRNDTLLQTTIVDMLCATGSFDDLTPSWLQQAYSGNDAMLKCAVLRYSHAWSGLDKSASDLCDELTTMAMHDPAFIVRREARRLAVMTDVDNAAIPGDRDINEFDSSDNDTDMLRHFLMGDMDGVNSGCCTNSVVDDLECEEGHLHMECE